ncbi:MAG TPA: LLM class F420-dependent oxidoreductase, partial [Acidimicrobiia bacterium]|nr:LLM class F420-dependent oxidoreductase [Acidimicrobiia bacterium]
EPKPVQVPRPPIVIGGRGERRTLRLVARHASMWDALFVDDVGEWHRLRQVLLGHCQDEGRDPAEISCSTHLRLDPDPDPGEVAERAARLFEAGLDVVILGFTAGHDAGTVEKLAPALAAVG